MPTAGKLCNRKPVCCERDTDIVSLARLMRQHHVGSVVVTQNIGDGPRPLGLVTDRDIVVEVIAAGVDLGEVAAGDIMGPGVVTVAEQCGVKETLDRLAGAGVRRAPVVDARGVLVGVIALDDLLNVLAESMDGVRTLLANEQDTERRRRSP